tara:strand:+ start:280 stop:1395 length:1116 start_codon:yes stop_codon:yes gene_type:complete
MKVLYVGHYGENTGWANAAKGLILALDSVGIDVVCRNIKLTSKTNIPERIQYLETGDTKNVDYCIQHVLPNMMVSTDKFKKNIAYTVFETSNLQHHPWLKHLSLMSDVWVPCLDNKKDLEKCNFDNVDVVHHAFNLNSYNLDNLEDFDFSNYGIDTHYKFYTIADFSQRKNIESIIKCFYCAFTRKEKVALVLKCHSSGLSKEDLFNVIKKLNHKVQSELRLYNNNFEYPRIVIVAEHLSEKEILSLHKACDCFVLLSHGEAWSIPAFDAMCMGNHPICSDFGGPKEFIGSDRKLGKKVDVIMNPCSTNEPTVLNLYNGREYWAIPDESIAISAMKDYYENQVHEAKEGLEAGQRYSYESVGEKMKELLNA